MKRVWRLLAAALALLALTGCSGLSYEDLYCLPKASEDYYDLQDALGEVIKDGYSYLAPASGARQEPVQLTDLDGDGTDEAVAFFRSTSDGTVSVYIFSRAGEAYTPAAVISGAGSAVASVEYADLDGRGELELLIAYQVSESVTQALQVYHYDGSEAVSILSAGCSRYELADLDGDGQPELMCITGSGADTPATAAYFDFREGELGRQGESRLSFAYDSLRRIQSGSLKGGGKCMIFSGLSPEGTLLMDIYTADEDGLRAVVPDTGPLSTQAIRGSYVYPEDADGDGVIELPQARQLPAYDSGSAAQWVVDWYSLSASGSREKTCTVYRSFEENWTFTLPESWEDKITVKATDLSTTVSSVGFYRLTETGPEEILTIYTLRGSDRRQYAEENGLTILLSGSETVFAVALRDSAQPWEGTVSMAQLSELIRFSPGAENGQNP